MKMMLINFGKIFKKREKPMQSENRDDSGGSSDTVIETMTARHLQKNWSLRKKITVIVCACLALALIAGGAVFALELLRDPMAQFETAAQQAAEITAQPPASASLPSAATINSAQASAAPPTPDPYAQFAAKADFSLLQNTVNIMLIGVDYAEERKTWKGKHAYHADVMIVLSINTETNKISMISLPRDTYANIPGVKGIYKLNASIDCGGGWPKPSGFEKVCEAATWMLGGIPVKYYYAVDMGAVKGLVDAVGGVDFEVDIDFGIQGRSYKKGLQHMNGQAVLDYLRVRKDLGVESGDLNRIDRQKKMLIAIFEKLKETNLMFQLPQILGSFNGNLYTNTTIPQTAGLAAFAYKVDSSSIKLYSMDGTLTNIFNWNFVITDQVKRVQIIKEVYGFDAPVYTKYAYSAASSLWRSMQNKVIVSRAKSVLARVKKILDADDKLPVYNPAPTPNPSPSPSPSPSASPSASASSSASKTSGESAALTGGLKEAFILLSSAPKGYRKYGSAERAFYNKVRGQLGQPGEELKANIEKLCSMFGISKPSWRVNYERGSNQIYVDFN